MTPGLLPAMQHSPVQPLALAAATEIPAANQSRRLHPRSSLRCAVTIAIAGGSERRGTTLDLARDGLSLSTDKPIPPGSRCKLCFAPTRDAEAEPLLLDVKSVYSSYTAPGDFRIGMVFIGLDAQAEAALRALAAPA